MAEDEGGFFSRWSRRKAEVREGRAVAEPAPPAAPVPVPAPVAETASETASATAAVETAEPDPPAPPPPTLEDVAALTPDSDFRRFVAPEVGSEVKNAALKKLFADPHFNRMDGLDVYIDDYGKPDPLPAGMLRKMVQSQLLGLFADEEKPASAASPAAAPSPAPAPTLPEPADEDADLQLQPDDDAGCAGPEPGAGEDAARPD